MTTPRAVARLVLLSLLVCASAAYGTAALASDSAGEGVRTAAATGDSDFRLRSNKVRLQIDTALPRYVTSGQRGVFWSILAVQAKPTPDYLKAVLQVRRNGVWRGVQSDRVKIRGSKSDEYTTPGYRKTVYFPLSAKFTKVGKYKVRVKLPAQQGFPQALSRPVVVHVLRSWTGRWRSLSGSCGVTIDGTAWCWGNGHDGGLGNGTTKNANQPVAVAGAGVWRIVESGGQGSCGIQVDGTAWCWGHAIADRSAGDFSTVPVKVNADTDWASISTGGFVTCGVKTDGTAWCWGSNYNGERGNGTYSYTDDNAVTQVDGTGWSRVTVGLYTVCGVKTDSTGWCWGENESGQVGVKDLGSADVLHPQKIKWTWETVIPTIDSTCGLALTGRAYCWGEAGDGALEPKIDPLAPGGLRSLVFGGNHRCGIKANGSAWCWNDNFLGAHGTGTHPYDEEARRVFASGKWSELAPGGTCGIKTDDTGWCWSGAGSAVGLGGSRQFQIPVQIALN